MAELSGTFCRCNINHLFSEGAGLSAHVSIRTDFGEQAKNRALSTADLYLQPSHEEGFCLAYIEAASKVPRLIGTDTGAIRRVSQGDSGMQVVPPRSPTALASALRSLIHDLVHIVAPATQEIAKRWKQRFFQPRCARAADRVVAVSQATARDVARHYGRVPDMVIHPLADETFSLAEVPAVQDTLRRLQLPPRFILSVGTLEPRKNIAALVNAHVSCMAEGVDLPPLVIVGGHGWRDAELRATLDRVGASASVRYLGYLPNADLRHLYSACHALVMPSLYEGFGMPLLEAQLCGAAVLHGKHASMTEAAGHLGVAFEPSATGLRVMLTGLASDQLPLTCRLPTAIENDAERSAGRLWQTLELAWYAKGSL